MEQFCIITNSDKKANHDMVHHIMEYMEANGKKCIILENRMSDSAGIRHFTDVSKIPENTECAIVLGGDGTMIQAAIDLVHRKLPIIGVNTGNLGFLTEVEGSSVDIALDRLFNNSFTIENRIMLKEISYFKQPDSRSSCYALNDIVVSKRGGARLITIKVFLNNELADIYRGDGIIISTPTGSTGYNLSAGGPVLVPHIKAVIITPICPHSLNKRSLIVDASGQITLETGQTKDTGADFAVVAADGRNVGEISTGDRLVIEVPHAVTQIIKLSGIGFYEKMREKLNKA
ncbi:MAG: NAD(+)/NADH kinase [Lachnospiraceae bacterium]|nr:NAD(+)/NADH kinase [Lachnospiraceae bacterium]